MHLRARSTCELTGQPQHDRAGGCARATEQLEVGQRDIRVGDTALARASHRRESRLSQPFCPQHRSHSPQLAVELVRTVVVQREGDEAEAGMTDTHCVEIELELLRHDVGPTSRVPARPHDGSRPGTAANKDVVSIISPTKHEIRAVSVPTLSPSYRSTKHSNTSRWRGIGITAYTLDVRHAFDADHIGAIDNTTQKLMHEGQRPSESRGVRARRGTVR